MPYLIAVFFGNGTYGFPLALEFGEFVGGLAPVGAVLEGFGALAEGYLLLEV